MRRSASAPTSRRRERFSLYSNFSVGENLLVRLGKPDIAGFGLALKKKRMRQLADQAIRRFSIKTLAPPRKPSARFPAATSRR